MSKGKTSNVIVRVGDEDFNFDPRSRFSVKKTKRLNIEWYNKYNASKINLLSSIQYKFDPMSKPTQRKIRDLSLNST